MQCSVWDAVVESPLVVVACKPWVGVDAEQVTSRQLWRSRRNLDVPSLSRTARLRTCDLCSRRALRLPACEPALGRPAPTPPPRDQPGGALASRPVRGGAHWCWPRSRCSLPRTCMRRADRASRQCERRAETRALNKYRRCIRREHVLVTYVAYAGSLRMKGCGVMSHTLAEWKAAS